MKYETTKQNRPKTPNALVKAIEESLDKRQLVIRKIWRCNAGWGIVYSYASNSTLPPIKRIFKDTIVFTYYKSIEACLKGEYDRIVLGIDDGKGTIKDAPIEKLIGLEVAPDSVVAILYSSNGERRLRRMGRELAEHWGLDFITGEAGEKALTEQANKG